MNESTVHSLCK